MPDLLELPVGCKFSPRCPDVMAACLKKEPEEYVTGEGCRSRCFLHEGPVWKNKGASLPATGGRK